MTAFDRAWGLVKMPVIPGSLKQTSYSPSYEYGHPKRKPGLGATKVEEGDETEENVFSFDAGHTEDPYPGSRYSPINVRIANYQDAWEDGSRPLKGRQAELFGSFGDLFAYRNEDGDYRVYDGSILSQGEGFTAENQIQRWDAGTGEYSFDPHDTLSGEIIPGFTTRPSDNTDAGSRKMSRRMEMLELLATALSQVHPNARLLPLRGNVPVVPNPALLGEREL